MADNFKYAQLQPFSLAGAGSVIGDTSITLKSMTDIDGNALTMTGSFGTIGFGTLDPGNGTLEEQICFTGLTNNTNGTVTLTGVSSVTFTAPYTRTSGLLKTHAGSTPFIISNTSGFYDELTSKADDETISGVWTFTAPNYPQIDVPTTLPTLPQQFATLQYVNSVAVAGAPDATTLTKGIVQIATQSQVDARTLYGSTSAALVAPLNTARSTLLSDYIVDTGSTDAITIAPSPAITSYQAGQTFSLKVAATNSSSPTINVNGLGTKNLVKLNGQNSLVANDLVAGQVISVEYDGTNFQMMSPVAAVPVTGRVGKILQTQFVSSSTASIINGSTGSAFVNVAGLSVSITPYKATSQIIVQSMVMFGATATSNAQFVVVRNTTSIGIGAASGNRIQASFGDQRVDDSNRTMVQPFVFVDSPATTSNLIYKIMCRGENSVSINSSVTNANNAQTMTGISTLMVQEYDTTQP